MNDYSNEVSVSDPDEQATTTKAPQLLSCILQLRVHDLAGSSAWYRDVLGCTIASIDAERTLCTAGAVSFMLRRGDSNLAQDPREVAYIRSEGVDAIHERSLRAGTPVLKAPKDEPWGRRELTIATPDGHILTLGERC